MYTYTHNTYVYIYIYIERHIYIYIYIYIYTNTHTHTYAGRLLLQGEGAVQRQELLPADLSFFIFFRSETRLQLFRVWGHSPQWANSSQLLPADVRCSI